MRAITPLGRGLLVVWLVSLLGLIVGSSGVQIAGAIALVLAAASGAWACVNSGQGLERLYDPERLRRDPSDEALVAEAVSRRMADGSAQAAAYSEVMRHSTPP